MQNEDELFAEFLLASGMAAEEGPRKEEEGEARCECSSRAQSVESGLRTPESPMPRKTQKPLDGGVGASIGDRNSLLLLAKNQEARVLWLDAELSQALKELREKERENDNLAMVNRQKAAQLSTVLHQKQQLEQDLGDKVKCQADIIFMLKSDLTHLQQQLEQSDPDEQEETEEQQQQQQQQQEQRPAGSCCPAPVPVAQGQVGAPAVRGPGAKRPRRHVDMRRRIADLELQVEKLRDCPVCWVAPKELVYECGHQACSACDDRLVTCPMCRAPLKKRIRIYQS